ncbi:prephenate dehydratase [Synchytrium microbalum]|uniref:prephenate dehydratase n=1 Tax=Synchytrium microbalum TaxID=1806994 RepID=A0A507CK52_9FUNG|nr:prephenate dehydratase [Synchytrium microbalum]TPX38183.1 prephenate dehydratase [Synchytrium microbalum]
MPKTAFQGISGSYSEAALIALGGQYGQLGALEPIGLETFEKCFEAVNSRTVDLAFLPFENSMNGTFHKNYDLLLTSGLIIVGEWSSRETHVLAALPGATLQNIREIRSQSEVIQQCSKFLSSLTNVNVIQGFDTAGSASYIQTNSLHNAAAICSELAAQRYGLTSLLKVGIEDDVNVTRYLLIGRQPVQPQRHESPRTSVSVVLKNIPGAFFRALSCFSLRDLNISKIESRASARTITLSTPWEYVLYIDVDGSTSDTAVARAVANLEEYGVVKVLGSYPRYIPSIDAPLSHRGIGL